MKILESFLPSFIFFSTGSDSRFWEFHPSSVILSFLYLDLLRILLHAQMSLILDNLALHDPANGSERGRSSKNNREDVGQEIPVSDIANVYHLVYLNGFINVFVCL